MGLMNRVRRGLAELIKPEDEPKAAAVTRAGPVRPAKIAARSGDDFSGRLGDLLGRAGTTAVHAGRINLIGLDRIKEQFGAKWPRIADRADRITRSAIERHLVPGDIFTAVHGTNYLIVFGNLPRRDAQLKCLLIAREIAKALLGEEGASQLEIQTAVAKLDGSLGFAAVPTIDEILAAGPGDRRARRNAGRCGRGDVGRYSLVVALRVPSDVVTGPQRHFGLYLRAARADFRCRPGLRRSRNAIGQ
jgi:hypothetical protein